MSGVSSEGIAPTGGRYGSVVTTLPLFEFYPSTRGMDCLGYLIALFADTGGHSYYRHTPLCGDGCYDAIELRGERHIPLSPSTYSLTCSSSRGHAHGPTRKHTLQCIRCLALLILCFFFRSFPAWPSVLLHY
jgi:hypothetical protein